MTDSQLSVRDLRRLWRPKKERLHAKDENHPTNIRFHRACSWLDRVSELTKCQDYDLAICGQWTAFNALYGQWDGEKREPVADVSCWRHFLDRMLSLDQGGSLVDTLLKNRGLVLAIFDDEYLSRYYWQEPTDQRASKARKTKFSAQSWYAEQNWLLILDRLVERIYLLRCQVVHGAATYKSSYNRTAIRHCVQMMNHLLDDFLHVWIRDGAEEDWGIMCYPPRV